IGNGSKKGVPLSDVWEIPFLNPKAKERVGYPTQKPVLLLNQIIRLVTDPEDTILDPFCGSGTTLVAANALGRNAIGIDTSDDAISLTNQRLANPIITHSALMEKGTESYRQHDVDAQKHLAGIDYIPVHRNKGIDGLLKAEIEGLPVFLRVQRSSETIGQAASVLVKATKNKGLCKLVVIATQSDLVSQCSPPEIIVVPSTALTLQDRLEQIGIQTYSGAAE
ncbi:MAG: site-specific DNA-methyltransferase, partial [Bacteroidota bacterium]